MTVSVLAAAGWSAAPAVGGWADCHTGTPEEGLGAAMLLPRLVGRATRHARLVAEVVGVALERAGLDPPEVEVVTASAGGERATAQALLGDVTAGRKVSPLAFQHSVHNTAAALVSMSSAHRRGSTALLAGPASAAMGLLEGQAMVATAECPVVVAVADEVPGPDGVEAAAVVLSPPLPGRRRLGAVRRGVDDGGSGLAALLLALAGSGATTVVLEPGTDGWPGWVVDVGGTADEWS